MKLNKRSDYSKLIRSFALRLNMFKEIKIKAEKSLVFLLCIRKIVLKITKAYHIKVLLTAGAVFPGSCEANLSRQCR